LAKYDPEVERMKPPQDNNDLGLLKAWLRRKYSDKTWYSTDESGSAPASAAGSYGQPTLAQIPPNQRQQHWRPKWIYSVVLLAVPEELLLPLVRVLVRVATIQVGMPLVAAVSNIHCSNNNKNRITMGFHPTLGPRRPRPSSGNKCSRSRSSRLSKRTLVQLSHRLPSNSTSKVALRTLARRDSRRSRSNRRPKDAISSLIAYSYDHGHPLIHAVVDT
jgi:hypothetical protein